MNPKLRFKPAFPDEFPEFRKRSGPAGGGGGGPRFDGRGYIIQRDPFAEPLNFNFASTHAGPDEIFYDDDITDF